MVDVYFGPDSSTSEREAQVADHHLGTGSRSLIGHKFQITRVQISDYYSFENSMDVPRIHKNSQEFKQENITIHKNSKCAKKSKNIKNSHENTRIHKKSQEFKEFNEFKEIIRKHKKTQEITRNHKKSQEYIKNSQQITRIQRIQQ